MVKSPLIKPIATAVALLTAILLATAAYAGVTTIVGIKNYSDEGAYIRSTEKSSGTWIPAGQSSWADINIPWACYPGTGRYGFEEHHIWIEHPRGHIRWVLWQCEHSDGDWVRYNQGTDWVRLGPRISRVDGNRFLIINSDGSLEMTITRALKGRKAKRKAAPAQ